MSEYEPDAVIDAIRTTCRWMDGSDRIAEAVYEAIVYDKATAMQMFRLIGERWGEVDFDSARDPSHSGEHYLRATIDMDAS